MSVPSSNIVYYTINAPLSPVGLIYGTFSVIYDYSNNTQSLNSVDIHSGVGQYTDPSYGTITKSSTDSYQLVLNHGGGVVTIAYTDANLVDSPATIDSGTNETFSVYSASYVSGGTISGSLIDPGCFLPGTLITTSAGDIAVENLQIDDLILTLSGGIVPVKWVGIQQYEGRFLTLERSTVCFKEGSLGLNTQGWRIPSKDLYVTADHAMVLGNSLASAARLVNGITITQEATKELVRVYHVDLGKHHAILANGAWTESYREVKNRNRFHNSKQYSEFYPEATFDATQEPCLPAVSDQNLLVIIGELLACVPEHQKTTHPDVHLYVDGDILYPTEQTKGSYTFALPAGAKNIRLLSHSSSPLATGQSTDARQLGYCINELVYSTLDNSSHHHIAPHSPLLEQGFYKAEVQKRRWTKGNAVLPTSLFMEETMLTIKGRSLPMYLLSQYEQALNLSYQSKMGLVRMG
jgi:hypothetical protein